MQPAARDIRRTIIRPQVIRMAHANKDPKGMSARGPIIKRVSVSILRNSSKVILQEAAKPNIVHESLVNAVLLSKSLNEAVHHFLVSTAMPSFP